jgi:hypothetical protein
MPQLIKNILKLAKSALIYFSPKVFNLLYYRYSLKEKCDLRNPIKFTEKLVWLKLYWHDPRATVCADKYLVREFLEEKGYTDLLIPLIGVYESVEDIDIDALPDQFVLKATHGSGWNIIVTDKSQYDWIFEKKKMSKWLKTNYYYGFGETQYKEMTPRIVCEQMLRETNGSGSLTDYKIICFNGEPYVIFTYIDRDTDTIGCAYYDLTWNRLESHTAGKFKSANRDIEKPVSLERMLDIARKLSEGFPEVRVDLYEVEGKIYFGELTFFDTAGFCKFSPPEYDNVLGEQLLLPNKTSVPR